MSLDRTQCNPRTCADINADGVATDNFDCANSANDLSSTPASVICRTNPCTALECCTVAPPPPRTCADTDADGVADQFDCSNHQNDLTGNPERTLCSGDACSAPQCCTLAPVVAAATSSPGASVEVHETSTTMSVGGYVTLRLMYSLSAAQANVYAMSGTATARMQFPAAFQVAAPFGADVGGVPEGFFPFMDSEFDSWLTVGLTGGNTGGELALSPGFGIGAWTATSAFETDNGAVFWMTPENGPTERTPLTFAQLTITTEAYAVRLVHPCVGTVVAFVCSRTQDADRQAHGCRRVGSRKLLFKAGLRKATTGVVCGWSGAGRALLPQFIRNVYCRCFMAALEILALYSHDRRGTEPETARG